MIRSFMLLVMAVTTACGVRGVCTERDAPSSPGAETGTPTPIGPADSPVVQPNREKPPDDPDYWIEAMVFGGSEAVDQKAGGE